MLPGWKERAAQAKAEGYLAGNAWERELARALLAANPRLAAELQAQGDWEAYLQVRAASAMALAETLEEQGTPPATARELAKAELLSPP